MNGTVGPNGELTLDPGVIEVLGIEPGSLAFQRVVDGHLEIHFVSVPHPGSLLGRLRPYISEEVLDRVSRMEWHAIEEEAWRMAVIERHGGEQSDDDLIEP